MNIIAIIGDMVSRVIYPAGKPAEVEQVSSKLAPIVSEKVGELKVDVFQLVEPVTVVHFDIVSKPIEKPEKGKISNVFQKL